MKNTLLNVAPTTVVLAVVVYFCWPYLDSDGGLQIDIGGGQLARIDKEELTPKLPAPSERNLFKPVIKVEAPNPSVEVAQHEPSSVEQAPPKPQINIAEVVSSFELRGTFLGVRNCALIDGKLRFEGDSLPVKSGHDVRCTLQHVEHNKVVIRVEGENVRLDYKAPESKQKSETKTENQQDSVGPPIAAAARSSLPGEDIFSGASSKAANGNIFQAVQRALTAAVTHADRETRARQQKTQP